MKKIAIVILIIFLVTNPLFAKIITGKHELYVIGLYLSTYYMRNSSFPSDIEQLKQMPYFTETDIRARLDDDETRYNMFIESVDSRSISFVLIDGTCRLQLNLDVDTVQNFVFLENGEVYEIFQRDSQENIIEKEPYEVYLGE
ncbi:MAG: hypothetical protein J5798_13085 [Spirochaetaceae bacterium]|nr:hypothetical protein [Spirochaetaceae bacterium]